MPIVSSEFEKLKVYCDEKLSGNISFSIPTIPHEKAEEYLKNTCIDITEATGG